MNMVSGIYKIINTQNGKCYIGSSNNISKRWYEHRRDLGHNVHANKYLQCAWNKYGEKAFRFEILEECSPEMRLEREQEYLDIGFRTGNVYNMCQNALAPMEGRKHSEETKRMLSELRKGKNAGEKNPMYGKKLTQAQKQHLSDLFSGERNPMYGKHLSQEAKLKISAANTGHVCPQEQKRKLSDMMSGTRNPFYGRKHTQTSLKLMSQNRTGMLKGADNPVSRSVVRISEDNEEIRIFETVTEAASESNAQRSHIALVCKGKRKHAGGYKWMYLDEYQQANTVINNQIAKG